MIERWLESVFLKRALLSFATAAAAYVAAHNLPGLTHLSAAGIHVTVQIDPKVFADWLGIFLVGIINGAHDWAADRWPRIGALIGQAAASLPLPQAPAPGSPAPQVPDPKP